MDFESIFLIVLLAVTTITICWLIIHFIRNLKKYDYLGNVYFYIIIAYCLCLMFALYANFRPVSTPSTTISLNIDGTTYSGEINQPASSQNGFVIFVSSLFDALKMMAVAFDRSVVNAFVIKGSVYSVFGIYYAVVSFFALITTSISTILFVSKSFGAKITNFFRSFNKSRNVYYIFSDPQVPQSIKLANELKKGDGKSKKGNIVKMYIQSSSLKTQAGTEYRDALKNAGLDVRSEPFSSKLCSKIFNKHFDPLFKDNKNKKHRKAVVFGLFSNDALSTELAINFTKAINDNNFEKTKNDKKFKGNNANFKVLFQKYTDEKFDINTADNEQIEDDFEKLNHFRVFVTYQDADIDLNHNFSGRTLHIVNTLSQYDMISSEFVLTNPITNFIDIEEINTSKDKSLNVTFLGLGKVNAPIFEKLTYAYQLWGNNKFLINYHILDKNANSLVENYSNEFTNFNKKEATSKDYLEKPYLYNIEADCDGKDLSSFEVLSNHIKNIAKKDGRFENPGFEMFVISLRNTNTDVDVALNLRKALLKNIDNEKLNKTVIFVRIADQSIIDTLEPENNFVIKQSELNEHKLGNLVNKGNKIIVPIIVFGQNAMMSRFVEDHYSVLTKLGICTQKAYNNEITDEKLKDTKTYLDWIKSKKIDVLSNVATVYSLKTKLEIFGYRYIDNFENKEDIILATAGCLEAINEEKDACEKGFTTITSEKDGSKLMMLAELEHKRWVATSYLYYKYGQWKPSCYVDPTNYSEDKNKFLTSDPSGTKHICMTTNNGLKELYKIQTSLDFKKGEEEKALKLTFGNDIQAIIDVLKYYQKK